MKESYWLGLDILSSIYYLHRVTHVMSLSRSVTGYIRKLYEMGIFMIRNRHVLDVTERDSKKNTHAAFLGDVTEL